MLSSQRLLALEAQRFLPGHQKRALARSLNIDYVQRRTIANKQLMEEKDPGARAANLEALRKTADDPAAHREYLMRASLLESLARPVAAER